MGIYKTLKVGWIVFRIFQGLGVDDLANLFPFRCQLGFIKAAAGFGSQQLFFNHFFNKFGQNKAVALFIVYHQFKGVPGHVPQSIETNNVRGLEHSGFWPAHGSSEKCIHLGNRQTVFQHQLHGLNNPLDTDSVSHKIGCVLSPHNAFAENPLSEIGNKF